MIKLYQKKELHGSTMCQEQQFNFALVINSKKTSCGPCTILTKDEGDQLEHWIVECSRRGFPRRKDDILLGVQEFCEKTNRTNPFTNNLPGKGWYQAFMKRHPNLSKRQSESVTRANACVSKSNICGWFKKSMVI